MAITSTLNLSVAIAGAGEQVSYVPPGFPFANVAAPAGGPIATILVPGNNALAVPVGAEYLLLQPAPASTNAKTLKGTNGDTGFSIHAANPTLLALAAGATTAIVNSTGTETVTLIWF